MNKNNALVWFRQDLRIADNQALKDTCDYAKAKGGKVFALFFATPEQWRIHDVAPIQVDFIERHLNLLAQSLARLGIELECVDCGCFDQVPDALYSICQRLDIGAVFAHKEPELNECLRDQRVTHILAKANIEFKRLNGHCIVAPGDILNQSGKMFRVFTPFSRAWRAKISKQSLFTIPIPAPVAPASVMPATIMLDCEKKDCSLWAAGETEAAKKLQDFVTFQAADYKNNRDYPALDGTSSLSPYLAIGVLSPRQCLTALLNHFPDALVDDTSLGFIWLNELCWREFYRHLLVAFPALCKKQNFNSLADKIVWRNNLEEFRCWCEGRTGYPIVDAAMVQLQQTGWMHNRLRMIVASFLTKHLLIDWRWGEAFFKQHLIDGDLAANNGGWQWSAGTGCDAQPYFRIFNPISQSKKFDPDGKFIRKYLKQLQGIDTQNLHQASIGISDLFNTMLNYPTPLVEHKYARSRALETLSAMKRS